ncbi:MAG: thiol:disulfide interchange protein DsbA/DsbL [Betaproteobacteria bacterium]|nr:thiol:disulfide interchange protein DsbA/DsbL [Betaproteobacteria bacterium]
MQRRRFLSLLPLLPMLGGVPLARAGAAFEEGFDYRRLRQPLPAVREGGRIEVLDLFWYGCSHCHQLEPLLAAWQERRRKDVTLRHLPAVLGGNWSDHARAYFAAEALGVVERIHRPLFEAIHVKQQRLDGEDALAGFFAARGVPADEFRKVFRSFAVEGMLRQAAETTRRLGLDGVPALVVGGTWLTSPELTGTRERTLAVLDFLVDRARG